MAIRVSFLLMSFFAFAKPCKEKGNVEENHEQKGQKAIRDDVFHSEAGIGLAIHDQSPDSGMGRAVRRQDLGHDGHLQA